MKSTVMRALVFSLVTLWMVPSAATQEAARADLLTSVQVQELVATATTPADHLHL
jgi:hypothetical protein